MSFWIRAFGVFGALDLRRRSQGRPEKNQNYIGMAFTYECQGDAAF